MSVVDYLLDSKRLGQLGPVRLGQVVREATRRGDAGVQYAAFVALDEWYEGQMELLMEAEVLGPPIGKGRPKSVRTKVGVRNYTPATTAAWEQAAAMVFQAAWGKEQYSGPAVLHVEAVFDRPKALLRKKDPEGRFWRPKKPDADNVLKIVADAIVKAAVVEDDRQIVRWAIRSCYAAKGHGSLVAVKLFKL